MPVMLGWLACCGGSSSAVRWSSSGRDHATIRVEVHASVHELVTAMNRALGRPQDGTTDCALLVSRWRKDTPEPVRITSEKVELGAAPICGPAIAGIVASFAVGSIFITPAGGGPVFWTDRPLRDIHDRKALQEIPYSDAMQRLANRSPEDKRVVIAAETDLNAYDMVRLLDDVAAYDTEVSILFYAIESPDDCCNE